MTVKEALAKYGDAMTPYERKEILHYQDDHVYYLGLEASANKVLNDERLPNDGFDDDNGSYIKVIHDHIAYRYEILQVIGRGSFGQVVKARDHKTNQDVALKIIRNKKRFHQQALIEVKILEHLNRCCEQASSNSSPTTQTTESAANNNSGKQTQAAAPQAQQQTSAGSTASSSSSNSSPSSSNYSLSSSASSLMSSPHNQSQASEASNQEKQQNGGSQFTIRMIDNFYFRNHLCITFELLNMNLYELIKRNSYQGFSLNLIRKFAYSLVQCLRMLAREKIIHCDLKPENILLRDRTSSSIKVIDFGSSCFTNQRIYTYIQSRFYRSPEVILGLPYGTPIDMWSLACVLAELFTGEPLFAGENESDQLGCIMEVCSLPPASVLEAATRRRLFFDSKNNPRNLVNSKNKRRRVGSRPLSVILNCDESDFIDFLERCLEWDPRLRMTPDEAIRHPWLSQYVRRVVGSAYAPPASATSPLVAHHQILSGAQQQASNATSSGVSSGASDASASSSASNSGAGSALPAGKQLLESLRLNVANANINNNLARSTASLAQRANNLIQRNLASCLTSGNSSVIKEQQQEVGMDGCSMVVGEQSRVSAEQAMEIDCNNNANSTTAPQLAMGQKSFKDPVQLARQNFLANYNQQQQQRHVYTTAAQVPQRGLLSIVGGGANRHTVSEEEEFMLEQQQPQQQQSGDSHQMLTGVNQIMHANKQFISANTRQLQQQGEAADKLGAVNPLNRLNRDPSGNVIRRVSCVAAPASNLLVSSVGDTRVQHSLVSSTGGLQHQNSDSIDTINCLSNAPSTLTICSAKFGSNIGLQSAFQSGANEGNSNVTSATCVIRDSHLLANKSHAHHQQQQESNNQQNSFNQVVDMSKKNNQATNLVTQAARQRKTSLQQQPTTHMFGNLGGTATAVKRDALPHSSSAKSLYRLGEDVNTSNTNGGGATNFNQNNGNFSEQLLSNNRNNQQQQHSNFNNFGARQQNQQQQQFNFHQHLVGEQQQNKQPSTNSHQFNHSPSSVSLSSMKISTPTNKQPDGDLKLSLDQVQKMLAAAAAAAAAASTHDNSTSSSRFQQQQQHQSAAADSSTNHGTNNHVSLINNAKQLNKVLGNLVNRKNSTLHQSPTNTTTGIKNNNYHYGSRATRQYNTTSNSGNNLVNQSNHSVNNNNYNSSSDIISSTSINGNSNLIRQPHAIVKQNPYITSEQFNQWQNDGGNPTTIGNLFQVEMQDNLSNGK